MTFEQFQNSKVWCDNLPAAVTSETWGVQQNNPPKGWLYLGCLYIEQSADWWLPEARAEGNWYLLINRDEWITNDLESLERKLYGFAVSEGYSLESTNDLITEYSLWNKRNNLSLGSADEHLFDENLTEDQRAWLRIFSARWEQVCEREDIDEAIERRAADEKL